MKRDTTLFIQDILDSIEAIEKFSRNIDKITLKSSRLRQSAIVREIEIIGEATKNIDNFLKEKYPEVHWKGIAGIRDVLTQGYFKVDLDLVWKVIKSDLPVLKKQITKIKIPIAASCGVFLMFAQNRKSLQAVGYMKYNNDRISVLKINSF